MFYISLALGTTPLNLQLLSTQAIQPNLSSKANQIPELVNDNPSINQRLHHNSGVLITKLNRSSHQRNPLAIPEKPAEVNIDKIVSITLEEAIEFAINNNRQLIITQLELRRAQASLSAEKAARFPSLSTQTTLNRSSTPSGEIQANTLRDSLDDQLDAQQSLIEEIQTQLPNVSDPSEQLELQTLLQELAIARTQTQSQLDDVGNFATTSINGSVGLNYALYSPGRGALIK
ncbi:MAG: hypothetical protein ACFCAD_08210, partial [Pleurocapsa sp.]